MVQLQQFFRIREPEAGAETSQFTETAKIVPQDEIVPRQRMLMWKRASVLLELLT